MSERKINKILVTGGAGFLGEHVCAELKSRDKYWVVPLKSPRDGGPDLRQQDAVKHLLEWTKPDCIINLAARVGGIGANLKSPGTFFHDNMMINTNLIHYANSSAVKKFVNIGTICSYPSETAVPFSENDLWKGFPEISNSAYGIAKKANLIQQIAYEKQFGFNSSYLLPTNLYGPGDDFDDATSHVIPALIKKVLAAKSNGTMVECWGTGVATREFLYVEDCARAIADAVEIDGPCQPINIGSNSEISVTDLVELIMEIVDYKCSIIWDVTKPDGQLRRKVDSSLAKKILGFEAKVALKDGLVKTIEWYLKNV